MKDMIVVFGKPGAGKDTATTLLEKYLGYHAFHADTLIQGDYLRCLQDGTPPTNEMRQEFTFSLFPVVDQLLTEYPKVAVNYTFNKIETQTLFRTVYPQAEWIYIETPRSIIEQRLREKPRLGHPNQNIERILQVGDEFHVPLFPHRKVRNVGTDAQLLGELLQLSRIEEMSYGLRV